MTGIVDCARMKYCACTYKDAWRLHVGGFLDDLRMLMLSVLCCLLNRVVGAMFRDIENTPIESSIISPTVDTGLLHGLSWSDASLTLTRKEMVYTFENYTIDSATGAGSGTRWLTRRTSLAQQSKKRALLLGSDRK